MKLSALAGAALAAILSAGCTNKNQDVAGIHTPTPRVLLPSGQRSPAPGFSEHDIFDRQTVSLQGLKGQVVVLNFWATWCPPCREETPALSTLQREYQGQIRVVGVAVYSSASATDQFYTDYKLNYAVIQGSYELMEAYGEVGSIPTTFLIDKMGRVAARVVGSRTKEQYEEMIKPLLGE